MTPQMLAMLPQLIAAGLATEQQIAALIQKYHPGLTASEQTTILSFIIDDATKRIAIAQKDAQPQVGS